MCWIKRVRLICEDMSLETFKLFVEIVSTEAISKGWGWGRRRHTALESTTWSDYNILLKDKGGNRVKVLELRPQDRSMFLSFEDTKDEKIYIDYDIKAI